MPLLDILSPGLALFRPPTNSSALIKCNYTGAWSLLVPTAESAFNPCALALALIAFSAFFFLFGNYQLLVLRRKPAYGSRALRSVGLAHYLRLVLVFFHATLLFVIFAELLQSDAYGFFNLSTLAFLIPSLVVFSTLLPLHVVEVHKSIWQVATTLSYWLLNPLLLLALLYQDLYTNYPVAANRFSTSAWGIPASTRFFQVAEAVLLANSAAIFILETVFWKRAYEYTRHLKLNEVNVYSLANTNLFGRLTFQNLNPLIAKGFRESKIDFEDLPETGHGMNTAHASDVLRKHWSTELKSHPSPRLSRPLFRAFGLQLLYSTFLQVLNIFFSFLQPQLLKRLMAFFLNFSHHPQVLQGVLISVAMTVNAFVIIVLWNEYISQMYMASYKIRLSLTALIYEKALRLSTDARSNRTIGDIVNLISVDVSRVEFVTTRFQSFISAPLQFVLCILSLYYLLGWSAFTGLSVVAVALPLNVFAIKKYETLYDKNMRAKDMRTKIVSEILNSIKSIKLYSWEEPMKRRVSLIREGKELSTMKSIGLIDALISFSWNCVPYFGSCVTFAFYSLVQKQHLTSELIFPSLALYDMLSMPLFELPDVISAIIESKVSVKRILKFLTDEEVDPSLVQELEFVNKKGDSAVEIKNASFIRKTVKKKEVSFSSTSDAENGNNDDDAATATSNTAPVAIEDEENALEAPKVALANINFVAKKGALTCIVGSVGSGKTTFLQSLLGQLPAVSFDSNLGDPTIRLKGSIAYCPQQPWIMNASIKKNILFGHKYDPEFFERTVEACELKPDFEILPDGEETQVGEKGISLSGGQKARISLARAVYARADIYLLDDVLSAVDAHVSKSIINNVLDKGGMLSSKTLILSTNHIHVLKEADSIYVLDHGRIDEQGTYSELTAAGGEFSKLIEEFGKADKDSESVSTKTSTPESAAAKAAAETAAASEPLVTAEHSKVKEANSDDNAVVDFVEGAGEELQGAELSRVKSNVTLRRASMASFNHKFVANDNEKTKGKKTGQTAEVSQKGKVSWSTYARYFAACKYHNIAITASAIILAGLTDLAGKLWLQHWASINDYNDDASSSVFLVTVYALFGVGSGFAALLKSVSLFYFSAVSASKNIHGELVASVLKSPMSFFETTPTGRILNRFSEDINRLDERFPHSMNFYAMEIVTACYTLTLVAITLPRTIVTMIILAIVYYYVQIYYMAASRETKRFASVTRSPVYSHIYETIVGVDTIKAFKQDSRFEFINRTNLDYSIAAGMAAIWMTRWLNFRLKSISAVFLFSVSITCVYTVTTSHPLSAGIVGLMITFSLQISDCLNWLVRMSAEVETNAVAVERVLEYCDLKSEKPYVIEDTRPPIQWPTKGGIKFVDYTTAYKEDADPVLKNISFEVKPKEKVGIVGRTGAGKSTLTLALFRIIEATGGSILIDDIDTSKIGLYDLRSKLNIIPQDSQAFEGTVRQNLDPFNKHKDEEIWKALEMAHLKDHVLSMKDDPKEVGKDNDQKGAESVEEEMADVLGANAPNPEDSGKGLYAKVKEGGANLSAGQKQLLCLARALLNPSRILLLDEATAAVDVKTDKVVQETIRKEFSDRTILTIAHRIDTILDNDKILVLDKGEVKEFDSPDSLLKNKDSLFYSLCENGGYLKK